MRLFDYFTNGDFATDLRIAKALALRSYRNRKMLWHISAGAAVVLCAFFVTLNTDATTEASATTNHIASVVPVHNASTAESGDIEEVTEEDESDILSFVADLVIFSDSELKDAESHFISDSDIKKDWQHKFDNLKKMQNSEKTKHIYEKVDLSGIEEKIAEYGNHFTYKEGDRAINVQKQCIKRFCFDAMVEQELFGIPASITLAQLIIESTSLQSNLTKSANNLFGVKGRDGELFTTTEYHKKANKKYPQVISVSPVTVNGKTLYKYVVKDHFKKYETPWESIRDHSKFLQGERYKSLYKNTDYKDWADGLQKCGYATSKSYSRLIKKVIERHSLHIFDK